MALVPLPDEPELLKRLRKDDHAAFTRLYAHYWRPMLLVAWNHTKDKLLAEDMVHEVFMALWTKRHLREIESAAGFLTTAVKFSVFKHYQKEQHRQRLVDNRLAYDGASDDESKLDALFLQEYIAGLVEQMPEKCRLVFRYSREQGLKNAEIAEILNISEKGVEANLTRALKIIRKGMGEDGLILFFAARQLDMVLF
ncbi:sigma-70 family RNA polymerase sigma factor [Parapedobacter deserti]|uniref:Sigma-70 family RNA polymerase sigma factor n=1 Tax=Parapedobacter deserti TaxID=1912957 RepID=A0ABV7JQJ5_9SPHI